VEKKRPLASPPAAPRARRWHYLPRLYRSAVQEERTECRRADSGVGIWTVSMLLLLIKTPWSHRAKWTGSI
jgi:hypothetical protein